MNGRPVGLPVIKRRHQRPGGPVVPEKQREDLVLPAASFPCLLPLLTVGQESTAASVPLSDLRGEAPKRRRHLGTSREGISEVVCSNHTGFPRW